MRESSLGLPIAHLIGMLGNSGRIVGANLMPSAQHLQKCYTRRQFFEFLSVFWLDSVWLTKITFIFWITSHAHFPKKIGQKFVSLSSLTHCLSHKLCLALRTTLLPNRLYIKKCHLVKGCAKWLSLWSLVPCFCGLRVGAASVVWVISPYLVKRGVLTIRVREMSLTIYYLLSVNSLQM